VVVEVVRVLIGAVLRRRWWPSEPGEMKNAPGLFGPGASVAACAQPAVTDTGSRWP
jgi:hypothetical protein